MKKRIISLTTIALMLSTGIWTVPVSAADASAMEISVQDAPSVKVRSGEVVIEIPGDSSQHVSIYALTGQVVKQFDAAPGSNTVELPTGYYIVRVGHTTVKVAVK